MNSAILRERDSNPSKYSVVDPLRDGSHRNSETCSDLARRQPWDIHLTLDREWRLDARLGFIRRHKKEERDSSLQESRPCSLRASIDLLRAHRRGLRRSARFERERIQEREPSLGRRPSETRLPARDRASGFSLPSVAVLPLSNRFSIQTRIATTSDVMNSSIFALQSADASA